jgi:hypothetical protein
LPKTPWCGSSAGTWTRKRTCQSYVTNCGRLKLYSYLDALKEKAIDSVIYVQESGRSPAVRSGDTLGDMVDELEQDEHMEEFVSRCTKN